MYSTLRFISILLYSLLILANDLSAQAFTGSAFASPPKQTRKRVTIYGAGLAQGSTGENAKPTSVESGVFGASISARNYDITAIFSLASSQDTVKSEYGNTLINPVGSGKSGAFKSFLFDGHYFLSNTLALHGYAQYAATTWSYSKESNGVTSTENLPALCVGYGAGLTYFVAQPELINDTTDSGSDKDIDFKFGINLGLFSRLIRGDIAEAKNDDHRLHMLGTATKSFFGGEAGIEVRFNSITASATVPWVWSSDEVDGLTNTQLVIGLAIQGNLVQFDY